MKNLVSVPTGHQEPLRPPSAPESYRRRRVLTWLAAGVPAVGATLALPRRAWAAAEPLSIGFVYMSPITDAGWTRQHEDGRLAMVRALGSRVTTRVVENVPENADAERVIRDLARQGCKLIFTTSFGYMDAVMRVAREFPDVVFDQASGYRLARNLGAYNIRFYEGRYLAGLVAGGMTRSNVLGYVAALPIPEVIQGINAYTLAARSINPKVEVRVVWTQNWFDPPRERDAAQAVLRQGADVLTNHSGSSAVAQAAEAAGAWMLGYTSDMSKYAPTRQLGAVVHRWGDHYIQAAREVLAGTWTSRSIMGGLKDGMIALEALSPTVPQALQHQIERARQGIAAGTLHPFAGRLVDNRGAVRQQSGVLSDRDIDHMDWFVEGVVGKAVA
ncbi:MAG: BMP family ABC transporter substrate-binding protein [Pigmentiphaga sp.]|uniref:BMP family ABC transporter substrate-binding protein n=1 Tax=Pigmentiphaga sp. TaxID=1977564 RepID=UPI00299FD5A0|nr:BMP family ABC transporter substrate-binding protein [Pigmentiphaga sp.]MDX3907197.1 BMP family ABC transporter substrate-binding protein [Pigmentiphaga sp.]